VGLLVSTSCASNGGFPRLQCRWLEPSSKPHRCVNDVDSQINKITKLSVRVPHILRRGWVITPSRAPEVPEARLDVNDVYSTLRISPGKCGQVVTSSSLLNFSISERGGHKFLHVGKDGEGVLPAALRRRFAGDIEENILIRRCYEELYNELSADMLRRNTSDTSDAPCGGVITGVPGIGKSLFALYFMARFIQDTRFVDRRFAFEFARGKYCYFLPSAASGEYECYFITEADLVVASQEMDSVLILTDLREQSPPAIKGKYHYVFSSPDPSRYEGHIDGYAHRMYYMPVWSEEELTAVDPNKTAWMDMFTVFGGVPRRVLRNDERDKAGCFANLNKTIMGKGDDVLALLLNTGTADDINIFASYLIVHINPQRDETGRYQFRKGIKSFASTAICARIIARSSSALQNKLESLFRRGAVAAVRVLGAAIAGQVFESVMRSSSRLAGHDLVARCLSASRTHISVRIPKLASQLVKGFYDEEKLIVSPEVYYWYAESTCSGIDGFVVVYDEVKKKYDMIVAQTTFSKSREVNLLGLQRIWDGVAKDVTDSIGRIIMLFCTTKAPLPMKPRELANRKNVTSSKLLTLLDTSLVQCVVELKSFPVQSRKF
jgi:hypothetical protein